MAELGKVFITLLDTCLLHSLAYLVHPGFLGKFAISSNAGVVFILIVGEVVISRKSWCFDTHKTKWYRVIKRDYKAQQQLGVQLYLGVRSRIILEKDLWTSKGFVSAHKMVINIVSEVRCKPLQDMPAVVSFAFDNLQNRAYLFITNSVILHFAI